MTKNILILTKNILIPWSIIGHVVRRERYVEPDVAHRLSSIRQEFVHHVPLYVIYCKQRKQLT